jgi:hypothetical protein
MIQLNIHNFHFTFQINIQNIHNIVIVSKVIGMIIVIVLISLH